MKSWSLRNLQRKSSKKRSEEIFCSTNRKELQTCATEKELSSKDTSAKQEGIVRCIEVYSLQIATKLEICLQSAMTKNLKVDFLFI